MEMGSDIVALARKHVGEPYVFGARARFTDPNFKGPWDCAEFVTWVVFQATGEAVLLGCAPREPTRGDAYTGYWYDDAKKFGLLISVDEAAKTPGTLILRTPQPNRIGHIVISRGNGRQTVEAKDRNSGVVDGEIDRKHRGWEFGIRVPSPSEWAKLTGNASKPENWFLRPTAASPPDARVEIVQKQLRGQGYKLKKIDGIFSGKLSKIIAKFQTKRGLVVDGMVGRQTSDSLGIDWQKATAGNGTYNAKYGVFFNSLVEGGYYSADPDNLKTKRSIRTNNPGALNISSWQRSMKGFIGVTQPDNSPNANRTTIYRTPEHGVASWYELLARRYGFENQGEFTLEQLARKYAGGGAAARAVQSYLAGWSRASGSTISGTTIFRVTSNDDMLLLAKAMFAHEIGSPSPIKANQIIYGIVNQRKRSMPE